MADERALPEVQIDLEPDERETWTGPLLVARSIVDMIESERVTAGARVDAQSWTAA